MLGRNNDCVNADWLVIFIILNRYLSFSVRTKVRKNFFFTNFSQTAGKFMC
ncbi:Uncharacterised protein [Mycobacterium tuberculosis]|nr:Uncharacterised protein [Mycobacterium tuberculosis]